MRILSLIFLAFALLAPMQVYSAQRKPDIPDGEIGKAPPNISRPTTAANDDNYGNPDRTPKPLPKPGGLVGGIAGSIIIDTLVDVVDKGLDKLLDPETHTPPKKDTQTNNYTGCSFDGLSYSSTQSLNDILSYLRTRHDVTDFAYSYSYEYEYKSYYDGKIDVYGVRLDGRPYIIQCYKLKQQKQDDNNDNSTPTAPNATPPTPDNSVKPSPSNDPNNNPSNNPQPSPNPQNDPNSNPNSDDDPNNNPSNNPNNDPKKDPKANPNSKDDPNNESDKDKQKDEQDKPNQNQKDEPKPFVLPKFCDWAKFICDDTIKDDKDTKIDIGDNDFDFRTIAEKSYISLPKQCPNNPKVSFAIPFVNDRFELEFPLHLFCDVFALFKPVIIMFAYIKGLVIIGRD